MAFIVFEGLDGAGKSTLMAALEERLRENHTAVLKTREPGGTTLGEKVRELLLSTASEAPTPLCELLLYQAIRAQHVEKKIRPALNSGMWVICDRFTASSIAFQAGGRGVDLQVIKDLNRLSTEALLPDLWVLLDLSVEEAQKRMQGRELDRFEQEGAEFHEKVRQSYLKQAHENPDRWLVLNASHSPEQLKSELLSKLKQLGLLK